MTTSTRSVRCRLLPLSLIALFGLPSGAPAATADEPDPVRDGAGQHGPAGLQKGGVGLGFCCPFYSEPDAALVDNGYIGTADGNDGFGPDAGMTCDTISTERHAGNAGISAAFVRIYMEHQAVGDLVLKLRSPSGQILTLLNRPGAAEPDDTGGADHLLGNRGNLEGAGVSFGDQYVASAEQMGLGVGDDETVCPSGCSFVPAPGSGPGTTFADTFVASSAQGAWTLCAGDAIEGSLGTLQAWELHLASFTLLTTTDAPESVPDDLYLGVHDNDGDAFGPDAGMACKSLVTDGQVGRDVFSADGSGAPTFTVTGTSGWVGDLVIKVQNGEGEILTLLNRPGFPESLDDGTGTGGHSANWSGASLSFVDGAGASAESLGAGLSPSDDVCSLADAFTCSYSPSPGAAAGLENTLDFVGGRAGGRWTVCIGDAASGAPATFDSFTLFMQTDSYQDVLFFDGFE